MDIWDWLMTAFLFGGLMFSGFVEEGEHPRENDAFWIRVMVFAGCFAYTFIRY